MLIATRSQFGRFRRRSFWLLALVGCLCIIGTIGFLQLPEWTFSDAFYMTVITLTAVGYQEVHPLDDIGRLLAGFLLVGGITSMGLWFALITSAIVEMDLAHVFRTKRTMKSIQNLRDHIVVCGAGRTGRQVVEELARGHTPLVVIEQNHERADVVREADSQALVLVGDATQDETLMAAGIAHAAGLVTALSTDTDNLFVCLSARHLQPNLTIVARALDGETTNKLYRAGANHVVSPNIIGGARMASVLLRPQVMSFLDIVTRGDGISLRLEEVQVREDSPFAGQGLAEARIRERTGLIVIAIQHHAEAQKTAFAYNPGPEESIQPLDTLIVLGAPEEVDHLRTIARA